MRWERRPCSRKYAEQKTYNIGGEAGEGRDGGVRRREEGDGGGDGELDLHGFRLGWKVVQIYVGIR